MVEMVALWRALEVSSWLGIERISILVNSLSLIQWILGNFNLRVPSLCKQMLHMRDSKTDFIDVSFDHIYWEQTLEGDALSKQGKSLSGGFMCF